ncbi:MAG: bacterio-opsin activator domain-containing protein [Halodesulfurarchaeum sp.]|nr:bacterio-opsin activator domain-containing protein [Halodesulfurarchaeum sp.]
MAARWPATGGDLMGDRAAGRRVQALSVEEELHLKEDAMDGAPVGITISDPSLPDNPLIYVNDSFVEITGYDREEILGTNCRFLQGTDTDMDRVAEMADAVSVEEPVAVELKNYRKDGEPFWNRVEIAPIRDEDGTAQYFVGYQADVTDRKEAELALAEERETLDHVLSRVASLVPAISETIVQSDSRDAFEAELAARFAEQPDLAGAWLGRYNPSTGLLQPKAGTGQPSSAILVDAPGSEAALSRAVHTGSVQIATDPTDLFEGEPEPAATALVPLQYRDTVYGILAVATTEADLFDERETVVMQAVGQAAGAAINALERVSLSGEEDVVEVRLEIADSTMPLVELAETLSAEVTADGQLPGSNGATTLLLTVEGVPPETVTERLPESTACSVIGGTADTVLEWPVPDGPLASTLSEDAVRLDGLSATPSSVRLRFAAASEHMGNTVVGRFRDGYKNVELLAFHQVTDGAADVGDFRESVTDSLTDRQLEALQKAHVGGFFEWPRGVEGEALAEAMDIHPSTFHQHLRAAERKLIAAYFDRGSGPTDPEGPDG